MSENVEHSTVEKVDFVKNRAGSPGVAPSFPAFEFHESVPIDLTFLTQKSAVFEFTKKEDLIKQYFELRRRSYFHDKNMEGHFNHGLPDEYDFDSEILVGIKQGFVVAGGRFTVHTPENPCKLPTEDKDFNFLDVFPEYNLKNASYGEVHRFVVAPEFRSQDSTYARETILRIYMRAIELGMDYIFIPSVPLRCRMYQKLLHQLNGVLEIRKDVVIKSPKYDNIEMWMMVIDVKGQPVYSSLKAAVDSEELRCLFYRTQDYYQVGKQLVRAELITPYQRDRLLAIQENVRSKGAWVRFGELAVQSGYCTEEQIENVLYH